MSGIELLYKFRANGRRQEIAVGSAGKRTVRQMRAAARGVVYADDDLSREKMLNAEIPLVDFGIARLSGVEAVVIRQSPKRQGAISLVLGQRQSVGKRIRKRSESGLEIIFGKTNRRKIAERRARELKVRGDIEAVIDASAAANDGIGIYSVGKAYARRPVVAVD